ACAGHYPAESHAAAPALGVEQAALPYAIVEGRTGRAVPDAEFWGAVTAARVVCVGEDHPNPHHHWAQLAILDYVAKARPHGLARGLEMVQRPFQAVLDDYAAGRIDEAALRSRVGWDDRWGYDFALYRPVIRRAVEAGAALVALNAAVEVTTKVVAGGLESL